MIYFSPERHLVSHLTNGYQLLALNVGHSPANTILNQTRRRRTNIESTLSQRRVFARVMGKCFD